ncbi:stage VI sporulation protein D [Virgibacillus necropolis]|uniref:Stage VI sporulation protein D n=2 Tax=Virgibacillus necropolis TaxID=163877 RepID=A0A221MI67_9BACI|nr:stage VI sporulation protein D [Virgibacillus necropolis]
MFSFELNESLYFERGQGVAEILGISLEPEISIQPFNDYISIRGVIELNGEYQRVGEGETREDNFYDLDDYSTRRYVEQVVEAERGEASFSHRFPVEISVPTYRVNDMNDVTVSIDFFDYEIPDQNQLRLTSIIAIQGINDVVESTDEVEVEDRLEEEEGVEEEIVTPDVVASPEEVIFPEKENTFRFDIKQQVEEDIKQEEQEEQDQQQQVERQQTYFREPYYPADESEDEIVVEDEPNQSPTSSVKSSEDKKVEQPSGEKIDYLSDMFRQDEENYSKVRLCIVQDNDTIDTIAQRYKINPLNIYKQNNLEDETISEGQLLYIPLNQSK